MNELRAIDLLIYENKKGDLLKGFLQSQHKNFDVKEVYFSEILLGEIKGWKKHSLMTCNLMVPQGSVRIVVVNPEKNNSFHSVIISKENYKLFTIPPNYWFAFQGIGNNSNLLVNVTDFEHDDSEAQESDLETFDFKWV